MSSAVEAVITSSFIALAVSVFVLFGISLKSVRDHRLTKTEGNIQQWCIIVAVVSVLVIAALYFLYYV